MAARNSPTLRLSLVHQLALLLVASVLLAVTALGAVVAWNLREGFSDYLLAQDEEWLQRFAQVAAAAVVQRGVGALQGPPEQLRPLLEALEPSRAVDDRPFGRRPPPRSDLAESNPRQDPPAGDELRRPPPRGGPGGGPGGGPAGGPGGGDRRYGPRLQVVGADGTPWSGRPQPAVAHQQAIVVGGQTVAYARLGQGRPLPQGVDAAFLKRQYSGILLSAGGLALLAVAGAVAVGRRWLRRLRELQSAARQIAGGALDVRVPIQGNDELSDLAAAVNAMAASLQQLEQGRRRWTAELSHELRTPLAVMRGELECLLDGVRPLGRPALTSLQAEVTRLTRLADDFHHLALSDLRALPCTFVALAPAQLATDALARVTARATAAGLSLSSDLHGAPPSAQWDRQRIEQLLANLLENSLRYTDTPGRVELVVSQPGPGQARIQLADSAPGVPAIDAAQLFQPLYRADPSRSRRSGGSGLGLSICRAIVHSHGGHIEAGPSRLGGLCVTVTLPLVPAK
jgi:two-component system sensor histidine kinase BaeS